MAIKLGAYGTWLRRTRWGTPIIATANGTVENQPQGTAERKVCKNKYTNGTYSTQIHMKIKM